VVLSDEADPALLLIRRVVRRDDPWSGQVALPGGFRASDEEALAETARRETAEETGLSLDTAGSYCGELDRISPLASFLPPVVVSAQVYTVPSRLPVTPGVEAEAALWIAWSRLLDPANRVALRVEFPDGHREVPAICVGDLQVWGLTERIIRRLADVLRVAGAGSQPP